MLAVKEGSTELTYTEDVGCAITTTIPVKFDTAHGRSRPEVSSTKCIDVYGGSGVVSPPSPRCGISNQKGISFDHDVVEAKTKLCLAYCLYFKAIFTEWQRKQSFAPIDYSAEPSYQFLSTVTAARSKFGKPVCAAYGVCGSRNSRRFGRRATDVKK